MRSRWVNKLSVIFGQRLPLYWVFMFFLCAIALITILGSSSSPAFDSVASRSHIRDIYTDYRRLKEQASVDYLELKTLSSVSGGQRKLSLCGKDRDYFVPCYNVSGNLLAGFKDGEEYDRHCGVSRQREKCLVRTPKEYKIPLRWPVGKDVIWTGNVKITKDQFLSSGSMTKRLMLLEENQIAFQSEDGLIFDGVKDYARQIAEMIGLGSDTEFRQIGVRTVLDIGCGFGSFGAHLLSLNLMVVCIAEYEATGSQVQLSLERGLPAMLGNFISRKLPYPSLSYDMVHCAECSIMWDQKGGMFLLEVDRVLKPGGYFVLTTPSSKSQGNVLNMKKRSMSSPMEQFTKEICWSLLAQQDDTFVWQKTKDIECYTSRKQATIPVCREGPDVQTYYQPLVSCISGTSSKRWVPIHERSSGSQLSSVELEIHGVLPEDYNEERKIWREALKNYWSLLTPLIFSDHPKRPGDEDPLPPFNMIRNVMDMNAHYGGLNSAFLEARKSVWVMNVVPVSVPNTLSLILQQGFAGVLHDWCEPFPTYPRTYDMLHANGLLSHLISGKCSMIDLFFEMDRILRPEGWVVLRDRLGAIELARTLATRIHWEARLIDVQNGNDQRLLVCQKPFARK